MSFLQNMWSTAPEPMDPETAARMDALIDRLATLVVRRELAPAAIVVLESARPFTFAGSQALIFLEPLVRTFLPAADYDLFVKLLEDRERVEALVVAIESKDDQRREKP